MADGKGGVGVKGVFKVSVGGPRTRRWQNFAILNRENQFGDIFVIRIRTFTDKSVIIKYIYFFLIFLEVATLLLLYFARVRGPMRTTIR